MPNTLYRALVRRVCNAHYRIDSPYALDPPPTLCPGRRRGSTPGTVKPDLILTNGNVHTMDPAMPHAEPLPSREADFSRPAAVIRFNDEIRNLAAAGVTGVDLAGSTVVPGFIDAHLHTASSGLRHLKDVNADLRSISAIQAALRERADLDAAAPDHPVIVNHRGGHTSSVNSRAMQIADVNDKTPDPEGDPQGSTDDLAAYQDAYDAGELSVRVYAFLSQGYVARMMAAGVRSGLGNEWVRVGAMKMVCDGSISERTAWVSQPYTGRPDDHGNLVRTEEQLCSDARAAHAAGWHIARTPTETPPSTSCYACMSVCSVRTRGAMRASASNIAR